MDFLISKEQLFSWCSVPAEELKTRDDLKAKLLVQPDRKTIMEMIGNMMADEVIANNRVGQLTRWVLPAGPTEEYDTFISRVNREGISLANLHIFHMDEFLDWEGRPYPVADTYESLEGTMNAGFYGRIDPGLNVPAAQRVWPRIDQLDEADQRIEQIGGIDTLWAGVGCKGLVAFCEAPRAYWHRVSLEEYAASRSRIVDLNEDTIVALSERSFGGCYDRIPPRSVTLGFKAMLSARRAVLMIATGSWKQTVVRVILFSEPTLEYPVTLVTKYVPEVILACDERTLDHPLAHPVRGW